MSNLQSSGKFYTKTWFVILMIIFLFPIGVYLIWKYKKFNFPCRVVISIICFFAMLVFLFVDSPDPSKNTTSVSDSQAKSEVKDKDKKTDGKDKDSAPNEIELMSYAQTVIKDYYPSPKFPAYKDEYNFVSTGLRSKIEGKVSIDGVSEYQRFWIIIEFTDETYTEYNLVSLQIGDDVLYKK